MNSKAHSCSSINGKSIAMLAAVVLMVSAAADMAKGAKFTKVEKK